MMVMITAITPSLKASRRAGPSHAADVPRMAACVHGPPPSS